MSLLAEINSWHQHSWLYMNAWKPVYKIGDKILLFNFLEKVIQLVEVVDITKTPKRTSDGRHFVAYKISHEIPQRRMTPKRWKSLKQAGLIQRKGDAYFSRKIGVNTFGRFLNSLNKVAR